MSARRNLRKKFDPIVLAAKGCARISSVETAVHGAPLPDLLKTVAGPDEIDLALAKLKEEKGVILNRKEYQAYLKMLEKVNKSEGKL